VKGAIDLQARPPVVKASLVGFHNILGIFFLPSLLLETMIVVVVIVKRGEIENGLVVRIFVQIKAVGAHSQNQQHGFVQPHLSGVIEVVDGGFHAFFGVHPDAKKHLKKCLLDAKPILLGHGDSVALLRLKRP